MGDRVLTEDRFVAQRIKAARLSARMSQSDLARALGLTFQQVQKYEKGSNRVSAGRLHLIAVALKQPISFFFPTKVTEDTGLQEDVALIVNLLTKRPAFRRIVTNLPSIDSDVADHIAGLMEWAVQVQRNAEPH